MHTNISKTVLNPKIKHHPRHIRTHHVYDLEELEITLGTSERTLRKKVREGLLRPMDTQVPVLFHGSDIQNWCDRSNQKRKISVHEGEAFCFSCKASRAALPESLWVDITKAPGRLFIRGKCNTCGSGLFVISTKKTIEKKSTDMMKRSKRVLQLTHGVSRVSMKQANQNPVEYNADNERWKYRYLSYLRDAKGFNQKSLKTVEADLLRFDRFSKHGSYKHFNKDMAKLYIRHLKGQNLSPYTVFGAVSKLQGFLRWLKEQNGFKRALNYTDIDYLTLSQNEKRALGQVRIQEFPSLDQLQYCVEQMPATTAKERRNRAMVALLVLTGMRIGVLPYLRMRHIDIEKKVLMQDPLEVPTKYGFYIATRFMPVGDVFFRILQEYYEEMTQVHRFGPADPLFPKLSLKVSELMAFTEGEFSRQFLRDEQIARLICTQAFEAVGFGSVSPHKIRHTLFALGKKLTKTPEELKAWSQNMGHVTPVHMMDTYGQLSPERTIEVMGRFDL